jgi:hypothetical protein
MLTTDSWSPGRSDDRSQAQSPEARVRLRARRLIDGSAARLSRAATRAAGDSGAALANALINAIRSEAPPKRWPLPEVVRLFSGGIADRDRQVRRLLDALHELEEDLARLAEEDDTGDEARSPSRV